MQYLGAAAAEDIYQRAVEFFCLEELGSCAVLQWNSRKRSAGLRGVRYTCVALQGLGSCISHISWSADCTWLAADPEMDSGLGLEFFLVALSVWYWFHTCTISSLQVCSSWVPRAWHISYLTATRESKCSHYVWASWTREGHWHPGRADSDTCHAPLNCSSWALVQSSSQAVVEVVFHWHCCGNRLVLCLIHWLEEVQRVRVLSSFNEGRVSHEKQH